MLHTPYSLGKDDKHAMVDTDVVLELGVVFAIWWLPSLQGTCGGPEAEPSEPTEDANETAHGAPSSRGAPCHFCIKPIGD
jgi:hypothetical protein